MRRKAIVDRGRPPEDQVWGMVSDGDPHQVISGREAFRTATVKRDPGNEVALDMYPRWNLSEAMSVAGRYSYRSRGADAYSGTASGANPAGITLAANARVLSTVKTMIETLMNM